ncbi:helix-turn-helix domain-containing protein [Primorskyibacter sp. 2E107]|uniref:helix-turn-helix domain-containing protein n=1 Tax=Primorskyibacter sp. 2E107 TaxID=3403458 RepID=UPI003AF5121A
MSAAGRQTPGQTADAEAVSAVIRQMKMPANGTVTLDEWAEYAGLSKYRLTDAFRSLTGIPPMTFHNAEKLEIAKRLLVFEDMSVTDTCFDIGFESLGSFISKFTAQVGIPPGRYAKTMRSTGFAELFMRALSHGLDDGAGTRATMRLVFERPILSGAPGIVAAIFKRPIPSGYPKTWRFIHALSKSTTLPRDTAGYCLAASLPIRPSMAELINLKPALIGRAALCPDVAETRMEMVRPTVFDPPVTLAVPALFCRESNNLAQAG